MPTTSGALICGVEAADARGIVRAGRELASRLGLRVVLVHAARSAPVALALGVPQAWPVRHHDEDAGIAAGRELLERVAAAEGLEGAAALRVELGPAATALADVAREEDAQLIVVGCRSRKALGWALLGSVSGAVVADAPCPVVVVARNAKLHPDGPVLCGVTQDDPSPAAVDVAWNLASRLGARLVLVHAARPADEHTASEFAGTPRTRGGGEGGADEWPANRWAPWTVVGDAPDVLRKTASDERAQLIVVGSRGRGPVRSTLLGSTSRELATDAPCPVVVVPPHVWRRNG